MTQEEFHAREAIRDLVMRFSMASDRGRFDEVAACFAVDGVARWATGGGVGRADIEANLRGATANPAVRFVRHYLSTVRIELAPDMASATGRIHYFAMSNAGQDHSGVYFDRYVREGDAWLIASRVVQIDWQAEQSLFPQQMLR